MRRITLLLALTILTLPLGAENLRGPLVPDLTVSPTNQAEATGIGLESIVVIRIDGDPRFLEAIDLELTAPAPVADHAGAVTLTVLGPISMSARTGVADVVGEEILTCPLLRAGKSFYQIVLYDDVSPDASPAATRPDRIVAPESFPIALSVVPRMKGLSGALQNAEFALSVRPVTRDMGAVAVRFVFEDGTEFDPRSALTPEFELIIDGEPAPVRSEYLLEPGLHTFRLRSRRFQDTEITVGVDRGTSVGLDLPLELALAKVNYSAPRGSTVYVNGQPLDAVSGDFTVPPGEHTIVVVLGDYTVTRRFAVEEQETYSISIVMDIVIEEVK